VAKGYPVAKGR
jgi:cytochrome c biogenesis protein CcmG, thiol:disulfide interchange protein DsbE